MLAARLGAGRIQLGIGMTQTEGAPETTVPFVAAPGARLGQYVLVRELGAGGMGRVFESKHVKLGKRVAVKLLHTALVASPKAMRRFHREGRACSRIQHPHVVEVLDTGVQDGQPYLVMELVEGADLAMRLREKPTLEPSEVAEIFLPLCSALSAVHASGVVHRDLKPSNVILTRPRPHTVHPMLVDFGIAKLAFSETTDDLTQAESAVGTAAYMAPEQTRNAQAVDPTTDQYALGVMIYECLTGRRPFHGESHYDLMHAILHGEVTPPSAHRPGLPAELDALVLRALKRAPAERFPSVHALGAALLSVASPRAWGEWGPEFCGTDAPSGGTEADGPRKLASGESPLAPLNWEQGEAPALARARMSRRLKAWGATAAVLAVIAVGVAWLKPSSEPPRASELSPAVQERNALDRRPQPQRVLPPKAEDRSSAPSPAPPEATTKRIAPASAAERKPAPARNDKRRSAATPGGGSRNASEAAASNTASPDSTKGLAPEAERGTNGALILE